MIFVSLAVIPGGIKQANGQHKDTLRDECRIEAVSEGRVKVYEEGRECKCKTNYISVSNVSDIQMRHFKPYILFIIFTFFI